MKMLKEMNKHKKLLMKYMLLYTIQKCNLRVCTVYNYKL